MPTCGSANLLSRCVSVREGSTVPIELRETITFATGSPSRAVQGLENDLFHVEQGQVQRIDSEGDDDPFSQLVKARNPDYPIYMNANGDRPPST